MRKIFTSIVTMAIVLLLCGSALAVESPLGLTQTEKETLCQQGYTDYYKIKGSLGRTDFKPTAQFTIHAGDQEKSSPFAGLSTPTPSVVVSGDTAVNISDRSTSTYSGRVITSYDFQYRIVPTGQARDAQPIVPAFFTSWAGVQQQFAKAMNEVKALGTNAELELYLCVADGANKTDSKLNWSSNGNVAVGKIDNRFPKGVIWYFSGMVIEYKAGGPDFWPSVPALSYTGKPGTQLTIPAMVYNSGIKDTTNFAACWDGGDWNSPVIKYKDLTIDKGQKADTPITVTIPATTQKLWLRANVDGKTPATETNLENNLVAVTVGPEGVDLSVTVTPAAKTYNIGGTSVTPGATVMVKRKDSGAEAVSAVLTIATPKGTQKIPLTLTAGQRYQTFIQFQVSGPGTYTVSAQVWPGGVPDLYPADNVASCNMTVTKNTPQRQDTDSGIRTGLGG